MTKVEHMGGDRYRVRLYDRALGRQRSRSFRAASKTAANKRARKELAALQEQITERKGQTDTIHEVADRWYVHRQRQGDSPYTLQRSRGIVDRIIADLGSIEAAELTALHVDEWIDELRAENIGTAKKPQRRGESTLHHYFRVLRSILRQGRKWGKVTTVATEAATPPKVGKAKVQPPTPEVLAAILAGCTPHLRFAAALAARTGVRRGELAGLRWSDFDPGPPPRLLVRAEDGNIVETGGQLIRKGLKSEHSARIMEDRELMLDEATVAALGRHRLELEEQAAQIGSVLAPDAAILADLMTDPTGRTPRRPGWLTLSWRRACEKHGVKVRLHDLRHFHATLLLDQGLSLAEVADRVGHAQVTTTANIYAHGTKTGRARAAEIVGDLPW